MNGHKKIEDDDLSELNENNKTGTHKIPCNANMSTNFFYHSVLDMKEKKTFLELLLDDQLGKFTDEEIQREVDHLLFAVGSNLLIFLLLNMIF